MSGFQLVSPNVHGIKLPSSGAYARGWQCHFIGQGASAYIKKRLMFDHVPGVKGSGGRIPVDHPPWLARVGGRRKAKQERWFWSMEAALEWANDELGLTAVAGLE